MAESDDPPGEQPGEQPAEQPRTPVGEQPRAHALEQPSDPSRRDFFRAFGRQTASGAGQVLRAADQLRRGSAAAATELLGLGLRDPQSSAARLEREVIAAATPIEEQELASQGITAEEQAPAQRSAYLFTGDSLVLLDQRMPFEGRATIICREPSELASALRDGVAGGGPVLAQVAAYGLVLALAVNLARPDQAREAAFRAAATTIRGSRPATRAVSYAVDRLVERWETLPVDAFGDDQLAALRSEADAIAMEAALDHARLGRLGAELLPRLRARALSVLTHADMGPLAGGLVGTGFAVIQSYVSAGRQLKVWLTEAAPGMEGLRISAPQLAQADISHSVIPDSAVAWLLAEQPVDAVLLRADLIAANGDAAALLGSLNVARVAGTAGLPVYGCAPVAAIDLGIARGNGIPRSRREPQLDVLPADTITAYITEEGMLEPPFPPALAAAVEARAQRAAGSGPSEQG